MPVLPRKSVGAIFDTLAARWPDAHCELVFRTPFQLLVAVVLSAQATDKSVNKALEPLWNERPAFGPADLVALGEEGFKAVIRSINFAPTKARNAVALSRLLVERHGGEVPLEREALEALPGVGRKTANVILNVLCGLPTMPVDTHVARLACRMGIVAPTEDRQRIEDELLRLVPSEHAHVAHHLLIFHGRYHCTARAPRCGECPLLGVCARVGLEPAAKAAVRGGKTESGASAKPAAEAKRNTRSKARPKAPPLRVASRRTNTSQRKETP